MKTPLIALALAALVAVPACADPAPARPAGSVRLDPLSWFTGRTHNEGMVRPMMGDPERLVVDGTGRRLPDGSLELTQVIFRNGQVAMRRTWRVTPAGPDRWSIRGSDVAGVGSARREGDAVVLDWTRVGGDLHARQRLTLDARGRVTNTMSLARMGVTLARITETIVRQDGPPAP